MTFSPPPRHPLALPVITPFTNEMAALSQAQASVVASGNFGGAVTHFMPMYPFEPFTVAEAFWCNGATIGTDTVDIGVYQMTDMTTGRMDLIRSTGPIYQAEAPSVVQGTGSIPIVGTNITSGNDSTDATVYTTASVRLVKGRLYLMSVINTAASAAVISSIGSGPTFTSRSSTQFNGTAHRTSIWSAVPSVDYIGTLTINYGATQTGAAWVLDEFANVDTASNDGTIQPTAASGSSTTPTVTLAAFASTKNATYAAHGNSADTTTTPAANFVELADVNAATPVQCIETQWRSDNQTSCTATITSGPWGSVAVELKRLTSPTVHWRIASANLTSGNDSTDASAYTTASVTLKAGRLYLMSVVNTAASAAVISSIAGGPTWSSRSSTQFNTTAHRVNIWSGVPTVDYTGTVVINYGSTQTGACWVLDEFSGVDTSSNDGIVQQAVGTGNSTTTLATLSAFASHANATYGASGVANTSTVAPGTGFTELAEATAATPASRVESEWRVDSYASVWSTVTSGQWGICALELKADTSALIIPPSMPGAPNVYMAMTVSGNSATFIRLAGATSRAAGYMTQGTTLPSSLLVTGTAPVRYPLAGFSSRTLID